METDTDHMQEKTKWTTSTQQYDKHSTEEVPSAGPDPQTSTIQGQACSPVKPSQPRIDSFNMANITVAYGQLKLLTLGKRDGFKE